MDRLGITGLELAQRARVGEATVSRALNGRPIQPATLRAIAKALGEFEPVPGTDGLIDHNGADAGVANGG
jgi:transcriptional regulator with XRE-family HTH domain